MFTSPGVGFFFTGAEWVATTASFLASCNVEFVKRGGDVFGLISCGWSIGFVLGLSNADEGGSTRPYVYSFLSFLLRAPTNAGVTINDRYFSFFMATE